MSLHFVWRWLQSRAKVILFRSWCSLIGLTCKAPGHHSVCFTRHLNIECVFSDLLIFDKINSGTASARGVRGMRGLQNPLWCLDPTPYSANPAYLGAATCTRTAHIAQPLSGWLMATLRLFMLHCSWTLIVSKKICCYNLFMFLGLSEKRNIFFIKMIFRARSART